MAMEQRRIRILRSRMILERCSTVRVTLRGRMGRFRETIRGIYDIIVDPPVRSTADKSFQRRRLLELVSRRTSRGHGIESRVVMQSHG
jgi:hypothetical protein